MVQTPQLGIGTFQRNRSMTNITQHHMTHHHLPSPSLGPEDKDKGEGGEVLEKPEYQTMSDVPAPAPTSQQLKPALQAATTTPSTGLPAQAPPASSPLAPPASTPPPRGAGPATFGAGVPVQGGPPPYPGAAGPYQGAPGASHPHRGHKGPRRRPSLKAPQAKASLAARTRPALPPLSVRRGPPSPGPYSSTPTVAGPMVPPGATLEAWPPRAGPPRAIQVRESPPPQSYQGPPAPQPEGGFPPPSE